MLAKIFSGSTFGLESLPIEVEVDVAPTGLPSITIVGLPDKAVEEAKERVRAALKNSGAEFPARRVTINLAPADLPKEGPAYDLPIALGLLIASGQLPQNLKLNHTLVMGELSLDGSLRHTNGILPIALMAKERKFRQLFIPEIDRKEAAIVGGLKIFPLSTIKDLHSHLTGLKKIIPQKHVAFSSLKQGSLVSFDLAEIKGQEHAKRALEIAASGSHNIFLKGIPGAGKTMLARALPGILPMLSESEALEVTKVYSVSGNLPLGVSIVTERPFRSPHHTTSRIGLIGGGTKPKPGEISLAHRGVLFLDEFPEFPRHVLESLRQPIEDGIVQISRASGTMLFPAHFMLVAAANPCPCGYYGSKKKPCTCLPSAIDRYQKKISGPIIDRIDIHVTVPEVELAKLTNPKLSGEPSVKIQKRVQSARDLQRQRFKKTNIVNNSEMSPKDVRDFCPLEPADRAFLTQATAALGLTARSYYKMLKVARTIADLAGSQSITRTHLAEAIQYRPQDSQA
ncbi:MAG: YifB family Mg chelatase-like AAA ATPase [Candidatus Chisholmbacteria bacterium]|nr:YifB family Mg chelatase-like AAA ATPase [Candidatus Chisholmbacteria bacterium]